MAQTANSQEPTMEEILASIRRIISEDGDDAQPAAQPATKAAPAQKAAAKPAPAPIVEEDDEDDVLELTDIVPEEVPPPPPLRSAPLRNEEDDLVMVDRTERPVQRVSAPRPSRFAEETQLISENVREQAQNSFMQLTRNVLVSDQADPRSLEALVQDMLRPMVQQWLNQHLPSMVEGLVQQEIERVSRKGR